MTVPPAPRQVVLERLATGTYDLLVIGAGILGSRVAYEAARCGLRVALVDAGDFGGATSSASSKLVHGGFRYLETGQVRLIRAAQQERQILERSVAPGLVSSLPLVLVALAGGLGRLLLPTAVRAYRGLAWPAGSASRSISVTEARRLVPLSETVDVRSAALLSEAWTNDGRLVLATVKAAADEGADVANYLGVTSLEWARSRAVALLEGCPGEGSLILRSRAVVNATGPWVDRIRRLEDQQAGNLVRFSKGVNVLIDSEVEWPAGLALFDRSRGIFAVPWHGMLLIGVTDTPFQGDPSAAVPTLDDVDELIGALSDLLAPDLFGAPRVRSAFAGLRVLSRGDRGTRNAPRHHILSVGSRGMISVAGGKLTTHRRIAVSTLRALPVEVRPQHIRPSSAPLPGCGPVEADGSATKALFPAAVWRYLTELYGAGAAELAAGGESSDKAFFPIHEDGPDVWAQAFFARDREWAMSVEDVVRRRTTLAYRGLANSDTLRRLATSLGLPQTVASGPTSASSTRPVSSLLVPQPSQVGLQPESE